jgi:hypothetical protein
MRNVWLFRKDFKNAFPIGSRIRVTGPFLPDKLNDVLYYKYLGEIGTIVDYHIYGTSIAWIGAILDINKNDPGNAIMWFDPSEIEVYNEDYFC